MFLSLMDNVDKFHFFHKKNFSDQTFEFLSTTAIDLHLKVRFVTMKCMIKWLRFTVIH